ncbi:MAG: CAP domain-containing protein [Chloroflexota bacterium]
MERRLLIAAALVLLLAAHRSPPAYAADSSQQLVNLINAERARQGMPSLAVSSELNASASSYAREMASAGFFAHVAPDGSTLVTRDTAAGYSGGTYFEENLAAECASPEQVIAAWLDSPPHRDNLLSANVDEIGVGHVDQPGSRYVTYWVAEFGARAPDARIGQRISSRGGQRSTERPSVRVVQSPPIVPAPVVAPPHSATVTPPRLPPASLVGSFAPGDLGRPLTGVIADRVINGQIVQYFQRGVLEWHPENGPGFQIERRLIGDVLHPASDPPRAPSDAPPGPSEYFPFSPGQATGLGHFVADFTRDGQPIYFKQYFDRHGGVKAFGFPKDEPFLRDGLWTQRFQAAVFQYHSEYDREGIIPGTNLPWRYFRVQLRLLGEQYVQAKHLPFHD